MKIIQQATELELGFCEVKLIFTSQPFGHFFLHQLINIWLVAALVCFILAK